MKEISIREIEGFRIGNASDIKGGTGTTVILCPEGAAAGVSVMGSGPASRETDLLDPKKAAESVYGIVLSGGSAYGLSAADGVMKYLEERGIGFNVGQGVVPIVPSSCLFDLPVGDFNARPDSDMGYAACVDSETADYVPHGNLGAGTGATIGKFLYPERFLKSGLGTYAVQTGDLKVGAIVAVNALGDIYDADTGRMIAGLLNEKGDGFQSTSELMWERAQTDFDVFKGNTTIGCISTNGRLTKSQCSKLAEMAHDGYARAIRPVHTTADGDSIYFLSRGDAPVYQDALGDLAAYVMAKAINDAVRSAAGAYGIPAACDI